MIASLSMSDLWETKSSFPGTFERARFIADRDAPFDVIGVVQLKNPPQLRVLQYALDALRKRHPLLGACIATEGRQPPFVSIPAGEPPSITIERENDDQGSLHCPNR